MAAARGSLIVAAIGTAVGLYLIFNAGQIARHEPAATIGKWGKRSPLIWLAQLISRWETESRTYGLLARSAFDSLTLAGVIFVVGLAALVLAALLSLFGAHRSEIDPYVRATDTGCIHISAPFGTSSAQNAKMSVACFVSPCAPVAQVDRAAVS
jgi:hypothetical protein